jgi:hypothetical protein
MAVAIRETRNFNTFYSFVPMALSIEHGYGCSASSDGEAPYFIDNTEADDNTYDNQLLNSSGAFSSRTVCYNSESPTLTESCKHFNIFDNSVYHDNHFHNNFESTTYIESCYQHLNVVFGESSSKQIHGNFNTFDTLGPGTDFVSGALEHIGIASSRYVQNVGSATSRYTENASSSTDARIITRDCLWVPVPSLTSDAASTVMNLSSDANVYMPSDYCLLEGDCPNGVQGNNLDTSFNPVYNSITHNCPSGDDTTSASTYTGFYESFNNAGDKFNDFCSRQIAYLYSQNFVNSA